MRPALMNMWSCRVWPALVALCCLLGCLLVTSVAGAAGLVAAPVDLPGGDREQLRAAIAEHRALHPEVFEAVRNVKGYKPEHYKTFRNPIPMVGRELRHLGKDALLPMLEALAFEVWPRGAATDPEWEALEVGMLEAVAALHDPRSGSVLRAAYRIPQAAATRRAAAEGLGLLCDAASLSALTAGLSDARRGAAIWGLGHCRTEVAAERLVAALDGARSAGEAGEIARALGMLGSSWAWQAMGSERAVQGVAIRASVAAALVRGYVRFAEDGVRAHLASSLGMVAHPATRDIVAKHGGRADAVTRRRLDGLATRIERRARRGSR